MHSLCLAVALTFSALPDGAPEFLAPEFELEEVAATNTPGSAEWYLPVEKLKLPVTWRITRNGHVVTNSQGRARISLAPTTGLWPDDSWHDLTVRDWYCGYDVGNADYVRLPGESDPDPQYFNLASPEMFNLTWNTHVGSTNYHYSALACSNAEYEVSGLYPGRELFKPKSSRFDSVARSALLASYEAYYERLYYASQGQRNEWETDDWGETSEPWRFDFNPTNSLVATRPRFRPNYPTNDFENAEDGPLRPIPASRRPTDADNIASLIGHVRDLFPVVLEVPALTSATNPPDYVLDARPFVFRPHWLTDSRDYPPGDAFGSRLWWASTVPPPAMTQEVWGVDRKIVSSTLGLFPAIDEFTSLDVLWSDGVSFSCYATTLDMLADSVKFDCAGRLASPPCLELFRAVVADCPSAHQWFIDEITPFDFHGMTVPDFLTNAYSRAAASVPNREDAFSRYVDVGTATDVVRRMVPGRLDLVNQLLSVMDRTISIPSMRITSTNTLTSAVNYCRYAADPVTVDAMWNGSEWEVTGFDDEYTLTGNPQMSVEESTNVVAGIQVFISETATSKTPGTSVYDRGGEIFVTEDWMRNNLPDPSTNVVETIRASDMGVTLHISSGDLFVGIDGLGRYDPVTFEATPSATAARSYRWSEPESVGRIGLALGPHQPGFEAGDRAQRCQCAILDALSRPWAWTAEWRSEISEYAAGGLAAKLQSHSESCLGLLRGHAAGECAGYNVPEDYIPLPSSVRLDLEDGPFVSGYFGVAPIYPEGQDVTNVVYYFTLPVPGETVDASHTGRWSLELSRKDYEHIHYIVHTFDSNMVETVEEDYWVSDPREVTPAKPEYFDYGTVIESRTSPGSLELVFTNSYPPTVTLTGEAVTNTNFSDDIDAYDLEVWHEKEVISYIFEFDHTRDWVVTNDYGSVPYSYFTPVDPVVSNSTTTVELTVANSLPDDAIESRREEYACRESAELLFVRDGDDCSVYVVYTNPYTGEKHTVPGSLPYPVAHYDFGIDVIFDGPLDGIDDEHDAFDESLFYRVMTQIDWLWSYMKLEKEEQ